METELINHGNSNLKPEAPLRIFGIFRESFITIKRNRKLLFPVVVLVFLVFSHLEFAQVYLLEPVAKDFSFQLAVHPNLLQDFGNNMHQTDYRGALDDIRAILSVKLLISSFSLFISLVFFVATVSSSYEAYTAKLLDTKEMILKIRNNLIKPMLTGFYLILITCGSALLCLFSLGIISVLAVGSSAYVLYGVFLFSIPVLCLYVSALWMMSMVVSVIEGVGGLNAIVRAQELLKGKKVKASLIMMLVAVAYGQVHFMTNAIKSYNLDKWSRLSVSIPFENGLLCALKLFVFVVFTVFYHKRKASCDEKEVEELYVPIVSGEV